MRYLLVAALACFATPVMAGDVSTFDYEAEAALALASVKLAPTLAPTLVKAAPCQFCGTKCACNNCGCDSYHQKAGAVPAASTFHSGHNCPSCGYEHYPSTYIQRGSGPIRGSHLHACPKCGTTWFH